MRQSRKRSMLECCESPIEKTFLRAWCDECRRTVKDGMNVNLYVIADRNNAWASPPDEDKSRPLLCTVIQSHIGNLRVDFSVIALFGGKRMPAVPALAIECDGHDYHERTKEQAARDRARDRHLTKTGWTVLRFTGSEIYRDAARCAAEAMEFIRPKLAEAVLT